MSSLARREKMGKGHTTTGYLKKNKRRTANATKALKQKSLQRKAQGGLHEDNDIHAAAGHNGGEEDAALTGDGHEKTSQNSCT